LDQIFERSKKRFIHKSRWITRHPSAGSFDSVITTPTSRDSDGLDASVLGVTALFSDTHAWRGRSHQHRDDRRQPLTERQRLIVVGEWPNG
jgi:hypothetical protein